MGNAFRTAIMILGLPISTAIMILNWVAPVVAIIWLLVIHAWQLVVIGLIVGFVAEIVFGLLVGLVPVVKAKLGGTTHAARYAARALGLVLFLLIVLYASWVFGLAQHTRLPVWPIALWAYGTSGTPWLVVVSKTQHTDPMSIMWPSAAQCGGMAIMIAMLCGAPVATQGLVLIAGSLAGLLLGWTMGSQRVNPR